jgi:putative ABC transport system ATP-binding protein
MSAIIRLEHVEQWYNHGKENEVHSLKDVNLEIEEGDYVAFFGPSGCGKTTLLYATSGIDRVVSGKILIKGRDIAQFDNQELAIFRQTGIGIVFQQFNLVPSLTVLQNIALPMAFVGMARAKAEVEAQKLVDRLGLTKYAAHYPTELSGGQQQRVGIARALANNPPILIADEPLGNLDSENAHNVLDILKDLNEKDKRTIIMVTHEAWSLQDVKTIYHMQDGSVNSVEHRTPTRPKEGAGKGGAAEALKPQIAKEAGSAESVDMMVRILSNFFMRGHTFEEMQRFEMLLKDRFARKIDSVKFEQLLDAGFAEGGVGLWKRKSERIALYVESLMEKQKDLDAAITLINEQPEHSVADEIRQLRQWMLQGYVGEISPYKAEILDELIGDRIRRFTTPAQFLKELNTPVKEFGAGFPLHSAQKMAEQLEIIVTNAHPYNPKV